MLDNRRLIMKLSKVNATKLKIGNEKWIELAAPCGCSTLIYWTDFIMQSNVKFDHRCMEHRDSQTDIGEAIMATITPDDFDRVVNMNILF
jgi:hypothetical protein